MDFKRPCPCIRSVDWVTIVFLGILVIVSVVTLIMAFKSDAKKKKETFEDVLENEWGDSTQQMGDLPYHGISSCSNDGLATLPSWSRWDIL